MTTLDDAAERIYRMCSGIGGLSVRAAIEMAWAEATEECEARKVKFSDAITKSVIEQHNHSCDDCAAAIRGKP